MARHYKPVPWYLRKRKPRGIRLIKEIQSLSTGDITPVEVIPEDPHSKWIEENGGEGEPKKPKPTGLNDARYYVSATSGRRGLQADFEGFGVFDAQNYEYCVYASYTLGLAERRCKLMNAVDCGELVRYTLVEDQQRKGWWHVIDIYHADKPADTRWLWSGPCAECQWHADEMNEHDRRLRDGVRTHDNQRYRGGAGEET